MKHVALNHLSLTYNALGLTFTVESMQNLINKAGGMVLGLDLFCIHRTLNRFHFENDDCFQYFTFYVSFKAEYYCITKCFEKASVWIKLSWFTFFVLLSQVYGVHTHKLVNSSSWFCQGFFFLYENWCYYTTPIPKPLGHCVNHKQKTQ